MLKIYGSDLSSPSNKVRFAANALDLKFEYIKINLREGEQRKPEFLKLNPAGKIPAINDDGFMLFESNAIIKYLARKQKSPLYPSELQARAIVEEWMDFTSMHVGMALSKVMFNRVFYKFLNVPIDERSLSDGLDFLKKFLPVIDEQLSKNPYLAGKDLTLADINLLATLDPAEAAQIDLSSYKNIVKWREAFKKKDFYTKVHKEYGEMLKQPASK